MTIEEVKKKAAKVLESYQVKDAARQEHYHETFPEDYTDGDVDMEEEADKFRWGFNKLYDFVKHLAEGDLAWAAPT